jgi:hypothetical protein
LFGIAAAAISHLHWAIQLASLTKKFAQNGSLLKLDQTEHPLSPPQNIGKH